MSNPRKVEKQYKETTSKIKFVICTRSGANVVMGPHVYLGTGHYTCPECGYGVFKKGGDVNEHHWSHQIHNPHSCPWMSNSSENQSEKDEIKRQLKTKKLDVVMKRVGTFSKKWELFTNGNGFHGFPVDEDRTNVIGDFKNVDPSIRNAIQKAHGYYKTQPSKEIKILEMEKDAFVRLNGKKLTFSGLVDKDVFRLDSLDSSELHRIRPSSQYKGHNNKILISSDQYIGILSSTTPTLPTHTIIEINQLFNVYVYDLTIPKNKDFLYREHKISIKEKDNSVRFEVLIQDPIECHPTNPKNIYLRAGEKFTTIINHSHGTEENKIHSPIQVIKRPGLQMKELGKTWFGDSDWRKFTLRPNETNLHEYNNYSFQSIGKFQSTFARKPSAGITIRRKWTDLNMIFNDFFVVHYKVKTWIERLHCWRNEEYTEEIPFFSSASVVEIKEPEFSISIRGSSNSLIHLPVFDFVYTDDDGVWRLPQSETMENGLNKILNEFEGVSKITIKISQSDRISNSIIPNLTLDVSKRYQRQLDREKQQKDIEKEEEERQKKIKAQEKEQERQMKALENIMSKQVNDKLREIGLPLDTDFGFNTPSLNVSKLILSVLKIQTEIMDEKFELLKKYDKLDENSLNSIQPNEFKSKQIKYDNYNGHYVSEFSHEELRLNSPRWLLDEIDKVCENTQPHNCIKVPEHPKLKELNNQKTLMWRSDSIFSEFTEHLYNTYEEKRTTLSESDQWRVISGTTKSFFELRRSVRTEYFKYVSQFSIEKLDQELVKNTIKKMFEKESLSQLFLLTSTNKPYTHQILGIPLDSLEDNPDPIDLGMILSEPSIDELDETITGYIEAIKLHHEGMPYEKGEFVGAKNSLTDEYVIGRYIDDCYVSRNLKNDKKKRYVFLRKATLEEKSQYDLVTQKIEEFKKKNIDSFYARLSKNNIDKHGLPLRKLESDLKKQIDDFDGVIDFYFDKKKHVLKSYKNGISRSLEGYKFASIVDEHCIEEKNVYHNCNEVKFNDYVDELKHILTLVKEKLSLSSIKQSENFQEDENETKIPPFSQNQGSQKNSRKRNEPFNPFAPNAAAERKRQNKSRLEVRSTSTQHESSQKSLEEMQKQIKDLIESKKSIDSDLKQFKRIVRFRSVAERRENENKVEQLENDRKKIIEEIKSLREQIREIEGDNNVE